MTKQLQKAILKHLEGDVSMLRVWAFNDGLAVDRCIDAEEKEFAIKNFNSVTLRLKQAEKNLAEFKKLDK